MHHHHLPTFALTLTLLAGCGETPEPSLETSGTSQEAIAGGEADASADHVGAIVGDFPSYGKIVFMTGTLISDRHVLTAAHAATFVHTPPILLAVFGELPTAIGITFDPVVDASTELLPFSGMANHPSFNLFAYFAWVASEPNVDLDADIHDVAVLTLAEPVRGIQPARLSKIGFLDQQPVTKHRFALSGYGWDGSFTPTNERRTGSSAGRRLGAHWLVVDGEGGVGCRHDSGSPVTLESTRQIVGTFTQSDFACADRNYVYRIDTESAGAFIRSQLQ